ncbi:hypothetical protein GCM10025867_51300 (plasmid) [Frondihabitans sucicola]|uniref:DUF2470 domain-containing protein n=1 Tax=Frondihabitans sucicola TaxID=1268041 RepID=A0ABN6Y845_9MICO|nr:hypothetical protein [Frondihabitans sucicola]BDZ52322.1 hypothetical protein GCM10025867_45630 [Frondihabitans sucicola]BDZ52889.1 hypothetical protein GCM10025867_51300 [Frondihabitans sucicola]
MSTRKTFTESRTVIEHYGSQHMAAVMHDGHASIHLQESDEAGRMTLSATFYPSVEQLREHAAGIQALIDAMVANGEPEARKGKLNQAEIAEWRAIAYPDAEVER